MSFLRTVTRWQGRDEEIRAVGVGVHWMLREQGDLSTLFQTCVLVFLLSMGTPISSSACEIYPLMHLEDVFLHFIQKFETLPNPRSVAEARIMTEELKALTNWFLEGLETRTWCESTWQIAEASASRQEMFGALFLIFASEVCRDSASEDGVWPAVTAVLRANKASFAALFVNGQPTTACKRAIAAGTRRLNLRNLVDRYGAQEYFDTLKLQFGFTIKGALRRLPDWLDGLGQPIAVKILGGLEAEYADLKSSSFTKLWKTLLDFRRSNVSEEYTSSMLKASPWIRPEWSAELLRVAKLRIQRVSLSAIAEEPERSSESICEPILRWEYPSKPQLVLRLNEERIQEILKEFESATFDIDHQVVDRWFVQEGGDWRGRRELPCQPENKKSNLRPRLLSITSEGRPVEEIDLSEVGMGEPLQIFDLKKGTQVDLSFRLEPSRDYGLICDADLGIPDATPSLKLKDCSVYRLAAPWRRDLKVVCAGTLYWQPNIAERTQFEPIRLRLESPPGVVAEIGSASSVRVIDVPDDVTAVSLTAGNSSYSAILNGGAWQTQKPLPITLGMALGTERVRVRLISPTYSRTVAPKLSLNLRGIACVEADSNIDSEPQWKLMNRNRPLNRADGSGKARIFVEAGGYQLYEGPVLVANLTSRLLPMRDLNGWGDPLNVRGADYSNFVLVGSSEDRGCVRLYVGSLLGKPRNEIYLRSPIRVATDHEILVWSDLGKDPRRIPATAISCDADGFIWKLPDLGSVAILAVSYRGAWIGSYWTPNPVILALRRASSTRLFGLLRWLKVPVLNPSFRTVTREATMRAPADFVNGWLGNDPLPYDLHHRQAEQGLDVVIRAFLWNYAERNEATADRLARAFQPAIQAQTESEPEAFKSSVLRLGEICPSLAYNLARHKLRGDKYRKLVRVIATTLLRQPDAVELPQLRGQLIADRRDCASLIGITPEMLDVQVKAYGDSLDSRAMDCTDAESDLRRLGERSKGRQFLTASLLLRLLERSTF